MLSLIINMLFPRPCIQDKVNKEMEAENTKRLYTDLGKAITREENVLKIALKATKKGSYAWQQQCLYIAGVWRSNGFEYRARDWEHFAYNPPKGNTSTKPASNAAPSRKKIDPEKWEHVNSSDPKYHNKTHLTNQEKNLLIEKNLNDFNKAAAIKFALNKGYLNKEEGFSNTELASMLSKQYGSGYGKDTVKKYAAVLRSFRNQNQETHSFEWAG